VPLSLVTGKIIALYHPHFIYAFADSSRWKASCFRVARLAVRRPSRPLTPVFVTQYPSVLIYYVRLGNGKRFTGSEVQFPGREIAVNLRPSVRSASGGDITDQRYVVSRPTCFTHHVIDITGLTFYNRRCMKILAECCYGKGRMAFPRHPTWYKCRRRHNVENVIMLKIKCVCTAVRGGRTLAYMRA